MASHTKDQEITSVGRLGTRRAMRSPVLNQLRLNPFRALGIPVDVGTVEALWKAEELLTLTRGGLSDALPYELSWMPRADEYELHQAVQAIEEPLRRLKERFFWFDLTNDPHADRLREILEHPTGEAFSAYLALPTTLQPLERQISVATTDVAPATANDAGQVIIASATSPTNAESGSRVMTCPACGVYVSANEDGRCPSCQWLILAPLASAAPVVAALPAEPVVVGGSSTLDEVAWLDEETPEAPPVPVPPSTPSEAILTAGEDELAALLPTFAMALNQANLSLLWAAAVLHQTLETAKFERPGQTVPTVAAVMPNPSGENLPSNSVGRGAAPADNSHEESAGAKGIANLHDQVGVNPFAARELQSLTQLWTDALQRWNRVAHSIEFVGAVRLSIQRLGDELVSDDDLNVISDAVNAEFLGLLLSEIKLQVIDCRYDRVEMLLSSVLAAELDSRKWSLAFRPLRALFETEVRDVDRLLNLEPRRAQDLQMYIERLGTLKQNWVRLDATGELGLMQIIDDRLRAVFHGLKEFVDLATRSNLHPIFEQIRNLSTTTSLNQEIAAYIAQTTDASDWECYFCQVRAALIEWSIVLDAKKETHRTYNGNTTTIHYALRKSLVPRCERCANMQAFLFRSSKWVWLALIPALIQAEYITGVIWLNSTAANQLRDSGIIGLAAFLISLAVPALAFYLAGILTRRILAMRLTLAGERPYNLCKQSKPYRELVREGYGITTDFSPNAFQKVKN